eukprot:gene7481-8272_t
MGSSPSATINAVNLSMNSWVLCNSYSVSLTTANATMNIPQLCSFTLCPNQRLTVSLCGVGGASACTGNTLVRVLDSSKSNLMAIDDGCSSSSSCSYGQYVASSSSSCGTYYLAEGCYGMTTGCGGQPALYLDYTPTASPTRPSPLPSSRPTRQPTAQPSSAPSRQPTAQPSTQPSRRPTSQPSSTPSRSPSAVPSRQPSSKPTVQPSSGPSGQPTSRPTKQPSSQPSRQPTSKPSSQPTRQPNSRPSSAPTWQPSSRPSSQPSSAPTTQPTSHPTGLIGSSVTTVVTSNSSTATVSVVDNDEEKEEADDDEGVVREKVWGEGQMKSDDDNSFVGLDGRESLDALMARIMESQSISYDNSNEEDEDSDSNALSISFIFSSCSSSSIGSGTYISTNMLDHEGTETLGEEEENLHGPSVSGNENMLAGFNDFCSDASHHPKTS